MSLPNNDASYQKKRVEQDLQTLHEAGLIILKPSIKDQAGYEVSVPQRLFPAHHLSSTYPDAHDEK